MVRSVESKKTTRAAYYEKLRQTHQKLQNWWRRRGRDYAIRRLRFGRRYADAVRRQRIECAQKRGSYWRELKKLTIAELNQLIEKHRMPEALRDMITKILAQRRHEERSRRIYGTQRDPRNYRIITYRGEVFYERKGNDVANGYETMQDNKAQGKTHTGGLA